VVKDHQLLHLIATAIDSETKPLCFFRQISHLYGRPHVHFVSPASFPLLMGWPCFHFLPCVVDPDWTTLDSLPLTQNRKTTKQFKQLSCYNRLILPS
jgi:hypothetical protein